MCAVGLFAEIDALDARALEDRRAGFDRRARQPEIVVERMQVPAAGVVDAALIDVGRHHRPDLVAVHQARLVVAVPLAQQIELGLQFIHVRRLDGAEQIAGLEVAANVVARHPLADDGLGLLGHVPQAPGVFDAHPAGDLLHARRIAGADLAAVAAGSTPADARRLQHHDGIAALRQVQGGRDAGVAGADHAHIRLDRAFERGTVRRADGGGRVVGRGVLRTLHGNRAMRGAGASCPPSPEGQGLRPWRDAANAGAARR